METFVIIIQKRKNVRALQIFLSAASSAIFTLHYSTGKCFECANYSNNYFTAAKTETIIFSTISQTFKAIP